MAESDNSQPLLKVHTVIPRKKNGCDDKYIPFGRSGHRVVATNNHIYAIGGYNPIRSSLFDEVWRFNISTQIWTKLKTKGPAPQEVASHSMCLFGQSIVTFGGSGLPFGMNSSNDIHQLNLTDSEWKLISCVAKDEYLENIPSKRYGHTMHIMDNYMYICGGTQGINYMLDLYRLDLKTKCWEYIECKNPPKERYRHETVIDGRKLYMFGGGDANAVFGLLEIPVLDLDTFCWSSIKSVQDDIKGYPRQRKYHSCVHYKDDVYITGGMRQQDIFSDVWKFSLKSHKWTYLGEMPKRLYFHGSAVSPDGCMYLFGGVTDDKRTNVLLKMQLEVPSLQELTWEFICRFCSHLDCQDPNELRELGIPAHLVGRLTDIIGTNSRTVLNGAVQPLSYYEFIRKHLFIKH